MLTPPLGQTNCPYPATMHLTGFLRSVGCDVYQRDLGIQVVRDVLVAHGGDEAEELLELLAGDAPPEAKLAASAVIEEIAFAIRDEIDLSFGFSRYAERISAQAADFGDVEKLVRRRGVMDKPLERHLARAIDETRPTIVGVTCPFPGMLIAAFKIAKYIRKKHPKIRLVLGGGFVSTELREMTDARPYKYFDDFIFDEGYAPLANLMGKNLAPQDVPPFVSPDYDGIDWGDYFDVVETENPMHQLWSVGRWRKLVMARGCYWHKCAFCDVVLPYIGDFKSPCARAVVDAMKKVGGDIHFVDEAMPPALIRGVCEEILKRKLSCRWWGNIRFDKSFTPALAKLMAKAGCIAVTGGLECANDRLLKLMNKGITLASAEKTLAAFKRAGIMVHAYLMYDFPTETRAEYRAAKKYVKELYKKGLIQSSFWHRFALTVHSPIAREPEKFGIRILEPPRPKALFARNELPFDSLD